DLNLTFMAFKRAEASSLGWPPDKNAIPGTAAGPARKRHRFRFPFADDAGDDQIGIVERGPEGMAERVPQFATFVNRPRRRRRNMAGNPAGERELHEQL